MAIHQLRKHVFGTFLKHDLYTDKAKLSQEAAKTRPHFSLPKVIKYRFKLNWSPQQASSMHLQSCAK